MITFIKNTKFMVINLSKEISDILLNSKRNSEIKSKNQIQKIVGDGLTLKGNEIEMNHKYWGKHIPMKDLLMGFKIRGGCFVFSRSEFCVSSGIKNITNVFSISDFRRIKVVRGGLISDNIELDGKVIGKFNRQSIKPWNKIFDEINPVFETYFEKPLEQREIEEAAAVEEEVTVPKPEKSITKPKKTTPKPKKPKSDSKSGGCILLVLVIAVVSYFVFSPSDRSKCLERSDKFTAKELSGVWSGKDDLYFHNQYEIKLTLNSDNTYSSTTLINGIRDDHFGMNHSGNFYTSSNNWYEDLYDHYLFLEWNSPNGKRTYKYKISYIIKPKSGSQRKWGKTETYEKGFYLYPTTGIFSGSSSSGIILKGDM